MPTPATLRATATDLTRHGEDCDRIAGQLETSDLSLNGLLDRAVELHVETTWESDAATAARTDLLRWRRNFNDTRSELRDVATDLRSRAVTDSNRAAAHRREATALEGEERARARAEAEAQLDSGSASELFSELLSQSNVN